MPTRTAPIALAIRYTCLVTTPDPQRDQRIAYVPDLSDQLRDSLSRLAQSCRSTSSIDSDQSSANDLPALATSHGQADRPSI